MTEIAPSSRSEKKWMAKFPSGKVVHFGQRGFSDYTINRDPNIKNRYIARHAKNEDWKDPETPGFLSRWLLWNKTSLKEAIKDTNKRFGTKFVLR